MKDNPLFFQVQRKNQEFPISISLKEIEEEFGFIYQPSLVFLSRQERERVVKNCPYLFRLGNYIGSKSKKEMQYRDQMLQRDFANVYVKWIDDTKGDGLFAAANIEAKSFIGEYVGVVREVERNHPQVNPYCFHYPTRFWSTNYFVIDAYKEGNLARFINHSKSPNLQPLWILERGLLHLIFFANKDIEAGSELTFNYGFTCIPGGAAT